MLGSDNGNLSEQQQRSLAFHLLFVETPQMAEPNFTNRTVWVGDNLHVMRGINSECIHLSDPPFTTKLRCPYRPIAAGAAFKDTWNIDVHEHGELADHRAAYKQHV